MITPIPTVYKHTKFASRLDARWAVFFEKIGFQWHYLLSSTEANPAAAYSPKFWLADQQVYVDVRFQEPPQNLRKRMARYARNHALWVIIGNPTLQCEETILESEYIVHRFQFSDELEDQQPSITVKVNQPVGVQIIHTPELPGWSEEVFAICSGCGKTAGLLNSEILYLDHSMLAANEEYSFCCSPAAGSANHKRLLSAFNAATNERFDEKKRLR